MNIFNIVVLGLLCLSCQSWKEFTRIAVHKCKSQMMFDFDSRYKNKTFYVKPGFSGLWYDSKSLDNGDEITIINLINENDSVNKVYHEGYGSENNKYRIEYSVNFEYRYKNEKGIFCRYCKYVLIYDKGKESCTFKEILYGDDFQYLSEIDFFKKIKSSVYKGQVKKRQISIGMPEEYIELSLGKPIKITEYSSRSIKFKIYNYSHMQITIQNGKIVSIIRLTR